jgi:hypothetical protein
VLHQPVEVRAGRLHPALQRVSGAGRLETSSHVGAVPDRAGSTTALTSLASLTGAVVAIYHRMP